MLAIGFLVWQLTVGGMCSCREPAPTEEGFRAGVVFCQIHGKNKKCDKQLTHIVRVSVSLFYFLRYCPQLLLIKYSTSNTWVAYGHIGN
jgi:hypothetical protein